ncbi:uncharacterized protein FIBRA_02592 [Fibroporia radiculosa]|uniref:Uncharacterized protein n=1 Tax=Fibroporia radiculosa TaxID=599839 RepID=J4G1Y5_9APHY|nr:uncharacterized protein FIBRA_02592 [Fibroporia radiculosa]CCM00558.1 predicted protein [Fibroporia radiculosa]
MLMAVILYGIGTTQAYMYWWRYPNDTKLTRRTVIVIWLLETLHTAFCLDVIYNYTVLDYGQSVDEIVWSVGATILLAIMIAITVQSYFINRIWILSNHNTFITAVPLVFVVCELGATSEYKQTHPSLTPMIKFWSLVSRFLISSRNPGLKICMWQSNCKLDLEDLVMDSLLACYGTLGSLYSSVARATRQLTIFAVYANSFLATLNARQHWANGGRRGAEGEAISMNLTSIQSVEQARPKLTRIEIFQSVMTVTDNANPGQDQKSPIREAHIQRIDEDPDIKTRLSKLQPLTIG